VDVKESSQQRRWFWATLGLSSVSIVTIVFATSEVVENRLFSHVDYVTLYYLYITRGIVSSLLLAFWAAWYVLRKRRHSEAELERSRGLLEASPAAVAPYDHALEVIEWNATAERLNGLSKQEVIGKHFLTVPLEKEQELCGYLERVEAGEPILHVETAAGRSRHSIRGQSELVAVSGSFRPALFSGSDGRHPEACNVPPDAARDRAIGGLRFSEKP